MDTLQPKKSKKALWIIVGIFVLSWSINLSTMDKEKDTNPKVSPTPNPILQLKPKIVLSQSDPDLYVNGDVTIHVSVTNNSNKSIKYVNIKTKYYNSVNDLVNDYKDESKYTIHRIVGEIRPGQSKSLNGTGFNNDETAYSVSKIMSVEFMSGEILKY